MYYIPILLFSWSSVQELSILLQILVVADLLLLFCGCGQWLMKELADLALADEPIAKRDDLNSYKI